MFVDFRDSTWKVKRKDEEEIVFLTGHQKSFGKMIFPNML